MVYKAQKAAKKRIAGRVALEGRQHAAAGEAGRRALAAVTAEKAEKAKDKEKAAEKANREKQAAVAAKKKIEEAALEAIELEKVQRAAQRAGQRADKRMRVELEKISVNELKSRRKAALIAAVLFRPGNQFGIAKAHVSGTGYCT